MLHFFHRAIRDNAHRHVNARQQFVRSCDDLKFGIKQTSYFCAVNVLGKLNMLHYFPEKLFSGYDIQRWKPDPALMFHAAKAMNVNVENCILVDDSSAGAQSGIDAGMEVFYFCADPHNKPIVHPKVTTFTHLSQLPELWKARGWDITA
ncbi:6-phosphogluconate phosphatase [Escherichia coli]|uniref:6-phosphogluconate phosphatase n=1 Tax=Escherichia coli TaxID=562 RepID=UPI00207719DE|nr:6-phosphogluconate phosphatase [Escherichia coli]